MYLTILLITNFTAAVTYFLYSYCDVLLDIVMNGVNCSKVVREARKSATIHTVKTDCGDLFLNCIKIPSDIDVFLFKDSCKVEDQLMTKKDFDMLHRKRDVYHMPKSRDRLIVSFKSPRDINGTSSISGYLDSYFEDCVYLFHFDEKNETFSFNKLVDTYRTEAEQKDEEDSELSGSGSEGGLSCGEDMVKI